MRATRVPSGVGHLGDLAGQLDQRALVVVGHHDRPGEPDAVAAHRGRVPAQRVTSRPASAMVSMPCAITPGRPTAAATRSLQWIGLKSPEAPA